MAIDTLLDTAEKVVDYGLDVGRNFGEDVVDLTTGIAIAIPYLVGKGAYELITDPIGTLEYIQSEQAWEDLKTNVLNPIADSYAEYADPIEKFRKDPLFVMLDAMTLLNVGGAALGKVGKTLSISELEKLGEMPLVKRMGKAAANKFLKSEFANKSGISAWTAKLELSNAGTTIRNDINTKTLVENFRDMSFIEKEIGAKFTEEQATKFHLALKGLMHPDLFADEPGLIDAFNAYTKLSKKNRKLQITHGILNNDIFEKRSILPNIELMRRIISKERIPSLIPIEHIDEVKSIISTLAKDTSPGAEATRVAMYQIHKKGLSVLDEFFTPEVVAYLKNRGLPSGYISDLRATIIRPEEWGIGSNLFTQSLPGQFKKASGGRVLEPFETLEELGGQVSKDNILKIMGKTQLAIQRRVNEKIALERIIEYGLNTTDDFGNPLAKALTSREEVLDAIAKNQIIAAPGKQHLNRLATRISRSIAGRLDSGEEIGTSLLASLNLIIGNDDLVNAGLASGKMMYSVNPDLASNLSKVSMRSGKVDKFFSKFVDPIHETWKGIVLGLNPKFVINLTGDNALRTVLSGSVKQGTALYLNEEIRNIIPPEVRMGSFTRANISWLNSGRGRVVTGAKPLGILYEHLQEGMTKRAMGKVLNGFDGMANVQGRVFGFAEKVEDFFREVHFLDRAGKVTRKEFMKTVGRDFYNNSELVSHLMTSGFSDDAVKVGMKSLNKWFYDYNSMTQFEKRWMRRFIPFWGFVRHSLTLSATAPFNQPARMNLLHNLGKAVQHANQFEGAPEWLVNGGVNVGRSPFDENKHLFFSVRGMNPFAAVTEIAGLFSDQPTAGTPLTALSPLLKVPIEQTLGQELFGSKKTFTSPFVYEDPITHQMFYMDKYSGEISRIGKVTPNIIEHFARQVPQYQLMKDMLYPWYSYGTSSIFKSEFLLPKKSKPRGLTAARFIFPLTQIDKTRYAKSWKDQIKRSQAVLRRRLVTTSEASPITQATALFEQADSIFDNVADVTKDFQFGSF